MVPLQPLLSPTSAANTDYTVNDCAEHLPARFLSLT
ncbi:uncharacterized protein METZ01_LOCUS427196, partial [marine metagenome]